MILQMTMKKYIMSSFIIIDKHIKDADLLGTEQNIAYCSRVTRENNDNDNGIVYDTANDDYEEIHNVFIHYNR